MEGFNEGAGGFNEGFLLSVFCISVLISLVSAYYYLRLIKIYVFKDEVEKLVFDFNSLKSISTILSFAIVFALLVGWVAEAEGVLNVSLMWAQDNYGAWINRLHGGYDKE